MCETYRDEDGEWEPAYELDFMVGFSCGVFVTSVAFLLIWIMSG